MFICNSKNHIKVKYYKMYCNFNYAEVDIQLLSCPIDNKSVPKGFYADTGRLDEEEGWDVILLPNYKGEKTFGVAMEIGQLLEM